MITVHKLDHTGIERFAYDGEVIERTTTMIKIEARFTRSTMEFEYVTMKTGDLFVEFYYSDKWYNIFAIYEGELLKGWYCNISRPARFEEAHIYFDDLALDYFLRPDGHEFILDEDEFEEANLAPQEAANARAALEELRSMAARRIHPFNL